MASIGSAPSEASSRSRYVSRTPRVLKTWSRSPRPVFRRTNTYQYQKRASIAALTPRDDISVASYSQLPREDPDSGGVSRDRRPSEVHEGGLTLKGKRVLDSIQFQCSMAALIILNAISIGLETDLQEFKYWDVIENAFLACFALELVFKAAVLGPQAYFKGADSAWNVFDLLIVCVGFLDACAGLIGKPSGGFATIFRVIRLLRMLRIFRIVRFLRELYLLAFGFIEAAKAVFWVTVLMTFVLYVCSILLVRTLGRQDPNAEHASFFSEHFGSVMMSMWSLFELMASPNLPDYKAEDGLLFSHPLFALFLILFVIFGSFGMIALLTGVISESMFQKNQMRLEAERIEQERMHDRLIERCEELFESLSDEAEAGVSQHKLTRLLPTLRSMLDECGADYTERELEVMTSLIDLDHSGTITKDEFLNGISRMVLGVRPVSIQEIAYEVSYCRKAIDDMTHDIRTIRRSIAQPGLAPSHSDDRETSAGSVHLRTLEEATRAQRVIMTHVKMHLDEMRSDLCQQLQELRTLCTCTGHPQHHTQGQTIQEPEGSASGGKGSENSMLHNGQGLLGFSITLSDLPAIISNEPQRRPSRCQSLQSSSPSGLSSSPRFMEEARREKVEAQFAWPTSSGPPPDSRAFREDADVADMDSKGVLKQHSDLELSGDPDTAASFGLTKLKLGSRVVQETQAAPPPRHEIEVLEFADLWQQPYERPAMSSKAVAPLEILSCRSCEELEGTVPSASPLQGVVSAATDAYH